MFNKKKSSKAGNLRKAFLFYMLLLDYFSKSLFKTQMK